MLGLGWSTQNDFLTSGQIRAHWFGASLRVESAALEPKWVTRGDLAPDPKGGLGADQRYPGETSRLLLDFLGLCLPACLPDNLCVCACVASNKRPQPQDLQSAGTTWKPPCRDRNHSRDCHCKSAGTVFRASFPASRYLHKMLGRLEGSYALSLIKAALA